MVLVSVGGAAAAAAVVVHLSARWRAASISSSSTASADLLTTIPICTVATIRVCLSHPHRLALEVRTWTRPRPGTARRPKERIEQAVDKDPDQWPIYYRAV